MWSLLTVATAARLPLPEWYLPECRPPPPLHLALALHARTRPFAQAHGPSSDLSPLRCAGNTTAVSRAAGGAAGRRGGGPAQGQGVRVVEGARARRAACLRRGDGGAATRAQQAQQRVGACMGHMQGRRRAGAGACGAACLGGRAGAVLPGLQVLPGAPGSAQRAGRPPSTPWTPPATVPRRPSQPTSGRRSPRACSCGSRAARATRSATSCRCAGMGVPVLGSWRVSHHGRVCVGARPRGAWAVPSCCAKSRARDGR